MAVLDYDKQLPSTYFGQGGNPEQRGGQYGESFTQRVDEDVYAEEGSLFIVRSATLGTGVAQTANTTEDTTKPFIVMYNPATAAGVLPKSVRLLRLKMRPTAVSSGQTIQNFSIVSTQGNAYSSAGTDYSAAATGLNGTTGIVNIGRSGVSNASVLTSGVLRIGAPVTALVAGNKLLARWSPRTTTIPVVGDEYNAYFGVRGGSGVRNTIVAPVSTTVNYYTEVLDPIICDPGQSIMIIPWAASVAGAMSWEFELVWGER